jgi:hypothetical protein
MIADTADPRGRRLSIIPVDLNLATPRRMPL